MFVTTYDILCLLPDGTNDAYNNKRIKSSLNKLLKYWMMHDFMKTIL